MFYGQISIFVILPVSLTLAKPNIRLLKIPPPSTCKKTGLLKSRIRSPVAAFLFCYVYCLFAHLLIGGGKIIPIDLTIFITIRIIDIDYSLASIESRDANAMLAVGHVDFPVRSIPGLKITYRSKCSRRNRPNRMAFFDLIDDSIKI